MFWDASAIVPLLVEQPASRACRAALRADPRQVVWMMTITEVVSALCRLCRDGAIDGRFRDEAEARARRFATRWTEVQAAEVARDEAARLLHAYALRAADALQLAAAVVWADRRPRGRGFVCLDGDLCEAARAEGFKVHTPAG